MVYTRSLVALWCALILTACSSIESPDTSPSAAVERDFTFCKDASLAKVPPKIVVITPALSTPSQTKCSVGQGAGTTGCVTLPGIQFPAIEEDLNTEARIQVFSECLMVRRYSVQSDLSIAHHSLPALPAANSASPLAQVNSHSFEMSMASGVDGTSFAAASPFETSRTKPWQGIKDCEFCPRMVLVPAGSFKMGDPATNNGQAAHTVKLPSFLLGKYEVTQAEWTAVMGKNPSANKSCGRHCPVDRVTWDGAQEFLKKLNDKTGLNFRLPSEAEWEYAARAGAHNELSPKEERQELKHFAWYNGNSHGEVHQVGLKFPNAFGLHDMQGNVWEWVEDVHHENYRGASPDGLARSSGSSQDKRVLRGGSYFDNPRLLQTTHRNADAPDAVYVFFGFRVARDLAPRTARAGTEQSIGHEGQPR